MDPGVGSAAAAAVAAAVEVAVGPAAAAEAARDWVTEREGRVVVGVAAASCGEMGWEEREVGRRCG